jgi:tetratricopeptide (TPR) repeat protein
MKDEPAAGPAPPASPPVNFRLGRRRLAALLAIVLVLAIAFGFWLRSRLLQPDPPLPDLAGADPEVVEVIQEARDDILSHLSSSPAWGKLGKLLYAHQFNKEASVCFQQAESLDPREPAWPYLQGLIIILQDPDGGILCLERAVKCRANSPIFMRLRLAEALLDQNRLDEAQANLEQASEADPHDPRAQLGMGRLALLREQWQLGLEHLQACQDDVCARRLAHSLQVEAWHRLGQPGQAQAAQRVTAALPMDEPWPDPLFDGILKMQTGLRAHLSETSSLIAAGRLEEAIDLLERTLEKHPRAHDAWMQLGDVLFTKKLPERAEACFQKAVGLTPQAGEAWYRLGYCQAAQAHVPQAASSLRRAIELKPDHALAHYALGVCLKEQGNHAGAAAEFRAALLHRPDLQEARAALGELENPDGKPR